jgi:hypothetical protein
MQTGDRLEESGFPRSIFALEPIDTRGELKVRNGQDEVAGVALGEII